MSVYTSFEQTLKTPPTLSYSLLPIKLVVIVCRLVALCAVDALPNGFSPISHQSIHVWSGHKSASPLLLLPCFTEFFKRLFLKILLWQILYRQFLNCFFNLQHFSSNKILTGVLFLWATFLYQFFLFGSDPPSPPTSHPTRTHTQLVGSRKDVERRENYRCSGWRPAG